MSVDKFREQHHVNFVAPDLIEDFLSAQTYRPAVTEAYETIKHLPHESLHKLCSTKIRQGATPEYSETGIPCLKSKHAKDLIADEPADEMVHPEWVDNNPGNLVSTGNVLITRQGAGTIGRSSIYFGHQACSNDSLFKLNITEADASFVCAFLRTNLGERLIEKGVYGSTGQLNLSVEHIRQLPIFKPMLDVQQYIGDKVRQAEQLRAWAKTLDISIHNHFAFLVENLPKSTKSYWASGQDLDSYRINPKHYDPVVLTLLKRSKNKGIKLQPLHQLYSERKIAGGATPKGANYFEEGVLFARVQNVKPLRLDLSDAVYIDSETDQALYRSRCIADDIVLSITGYPGTASLVMEEDLPVNINQHSVRFGIKSDVGSGFVCAALNSQFLKYQVDRLSIGGTRDALDYPSVGSLLIPRFDAQIEKEIDQAVRNYVIATRMARLLTDAAKLIVVALIEGKLIEQQLITAQQQLQAGDYSSDQAILARLTTDGFGGDGPALFSDLEQLYALLDQAKESDSWTPPV